MAEEESRFVPTVVVIQDFACTAGQWVSTPVGVADNYEQALEVARVMVVAWNERRPPAEQCVLPEDPASAIALYQRATKRLIRMITCGYYLGRAAAEGALLGRASSGDAFEDAPGETITSTTIDLGRLHQADPTSGEH